MSDERNQPGGGNDIVPPLPGEEEPVISEDDEVTEQAPNVLDEVIAQREELQGQHHLILPVAGYKGLLAVRYNNIGSDVTESVGKKLRKELKARQGEGASLLSSLETLIKACDMVLIKEKGHPACIEDDDGKKTDWRPIIVDAVPPVRFDRRLARTLQFDADSAREVVLGLFASDHAVIEAGIRVSRWLVDTTREVDDDLLGE